MRHSMDHKAISKVVVCGAFILVFGLATQAFAALDVNKSFSPATAYPGQTSRLTITLLNSSLNPAINTSFTDVFPDDVFISPTPNAITTCGGSVTTNNTPTGGQLGLGGGTIPAGDGINPGTCSVQVNVYSAKKGTYINNIPVGAVTATTNGTPDSNPQETQGTLAIILQDLSGTMTFDTGRYIQGGETTFMKIRLTNPNPVPLTSVGFLNSMYATAYHLRAIDDGSQTTTCGGTIAITPRPSRAVGYGTTSDVSLSGGTIPANGTCEVAIKIESNRDPKLPYFNADLSNTIAASAVISAEGATNIAAISQPLYSRSGVQLQKLFNNSTTAQINFSNTSSANLRFVFTNWNVLPINNFNFTDIMPDLLPASGAMTVSAINSNTCGGTAVNGTTQLGLTGGNLAANPVLAGTSLPSVVCEVNATVSVDEVGSYTNTVPAGDLSTYQYVATSAVLNVVSGILEVSKSFSRNIYQGDSFVMTINMKSYATDDTISNIDLTDDLNTLRNPPYTSKTYFRVGSSSFTNTCGGTVLAPLDGTTIQIQDATLAPLQTCSATFTIRSSADAYPIGTHSNTIPIGNITFDVPGNIGQIYPLVPTATVTVSAALRVFKSWSPAVVGPLGISRLQIRVVRNSLARSATNNINLSDTLPTGYTVAPIPNISNGCGGSVNAAPGTNTIELTGGALPAFASGNSTECSVFVNVKAPALTPPALVTTATNTIPADAHMAPIKKVSALDAGQPAPYNQLENYTAASANITVRATSVTTNKEFIPVSINGGGVSRVRISFSNIEPSAINLTGVGITDSFAGTDLRLHTNVNPTFTDLNGLPNSNGCRLGSFTGNPGDGSITLSGAEMDAGKICYFEFNVTAFKGGNHINTLSAGDLVTAEGVTNPSNVAATLTVGRQVNVGKGFSPSVIGLGEQSTLTLDFYNTNAAPNDETGANPALTDTLPAGMQVVGSPTTTCVGGGVSVGTDGSGNQFIRLNGGILPAENICKIIAQVTTTSAGVFTNTIAIGDLNTLSGARNPDPSTATLRVIAKPTITKVFGSPSIPQDGISRITFTLTNPNSAATLPTGLSNVSFSDTLTNMSIAAPVFVGGTCVGLVHNAVVGGTVFSASGISIGPSGSCTVQLDVTSNVIGLHDNFASGVSSAQTVSAGNPSATVQLRVLSPATLAKTFSPSRMPIGGTSQITFTLSNPNPVAVAISNPGFSDTFPGTPGQMLVAPTPGVSNTCGAVVRNLSDTAAPVAGDVGILVRGGTIPAGGSCTVKINITASVVGNYSNTTSDLDTFAGSSSPATAGMSVVPMDFGDAPDAAANTGVGNYRTTLADGGPSHELVAGLSLGANIDNDSATLQNTNADADDADQSPNDEDGVSSFPTLSTASGQTYTVSANVSNTTGSPAYLVGYIDFNKDGDFLDAGEQSATVVVNASGSHDVSFTTPAGMTAGTSYARFRLSLTQAQAEASIGSSTSGEVEDYRVAIVSYSISGRVFEDINYGGGSGRDLSSSSGVVRSGARVELYNSAGNYVGFANTDLTGTYSFSGLAPGLYTVRVVNSTVSSSRAGYVAGVLPVQTFRTNGLSANVGTPDTERVGGEAPNLVDAPANTTAALAALTTATTTAQSITPLTLTSSDITGIDFGFNFDTIVSTRDSGQGSLRQFILNANALANTVLAQVGQTPGREVSIFMIPDGAAHPGLRAGLVNQLSPNGVAIISLTSLLPALSGVNGASTTISGFTQTANVGNTNAAILGTGGTVGTGGDGRPGTGDEPSLSQVSAPEVEIRDGAALATGLTLAANDLTITGISIHGFGASQLAGQGDIYVAGVTKASITQNVIGARATSFTHPGAAEQTGGSGIWVINGAQVSVANNLIGFAGYNGIASTNNSLTSAAIIAITDNEFRGNAALNNISNAIELFWLGANPTITIQKNLLADTLNQGAIHFQNNTGGSGATLTIDNNTLTNTNSTLTYTNAIILNLIQDAAISRNIIEKTNHGSLGIGIAIQTFAPSGSLVPARRNRITQNAIYDTQNGPGIDLWTNGQSGVSPRITPNDGLKNIAEANAGMDYPVITVATLSSGSLTVSGFVGNQPAGSPTFADAMLEFFIADNTPADQNGEVLQGDGKSLAHGEGWLYLGSCPADPNSLFSCTFPNAGALGLSSASNITATATDKEGNTSEFGAVVAVDHGDAPASYGDAMHFTGGTVYLGSIAPDSESSAATPLDGSGDDATASDDEGGVSLPARVTLDTTLSLPVAIVGAGRLNAWFDWTRDGDFLDPGEHVINDQSVATGTTILSIAIPVDAAIGTSYARFRLCSTAGSCNTPSGAVLGGEVEDYQLTIAMSVSGTVWHDQNSNITMDGSESGTNAGGLTVYAVDGSGNVAGKATVAADGSYTISDLAWGSYTLRLSTDASVAIGSAAPPTPSLPSGWANTGENVEGTTETITPGEIAITLGKVNLFKHNFGILQGYTVSGQVYSDTQPNGLLNPDENWVAGTLVYVNLIQSGAVVQSIALSPGTGAYEFTQVLPGNYSIVITNSATATAATTPSGWLFTEPANGNLNLSANTNLINQNFGLYHGSKVSGRVFYDDGLMAGTANDALQNGGELGVSHAVVTLSDGSNTLTTSTNTLGDYSFYVPYSYGASVTVSHDLLPASGTNISSSSVVLASSYADPSAQEHLFSFGSGKLLDGYNFGLVRPSTFKPDQQGQTTSPGTITYAHLYQPGTLGKLSFSQSGGDLTYQIRLDANCDGSFEVGETWETSPSMTVDDSWPRNSDGSLQTCAVEVRVMVPGGFPVNSVDIAQIASTLSWANNPSVSDPRYLSDTTVVNGGVLQLSKEVRNLTQGGSFATANQARPGDILEYRIRYQNLGTQPLFEVELLDPVPSYSDLEQNIFPGSTEVQLYCPSGSAVNLEVGSPSDLSLNLATHCTLSTAPHPSGSGPAEALLPGEGGYFLYRVRVR